MPQNTHNGIVQYCNQCQNPLEKARVVYSEKSKCNKCVYKNQREYEKNRTKGKIVIKRGNQAWKLLDK